MNSEDLSSQKHNTNMNILASKQGTPLQHEKSPIQQNISIMRPASKNNLPSIVGVNSGQGIG
jgi:hypothetical protein